MTYLALALTLFQPTTIIPFNGLVINQTVKFVKGTYRLPNSDEFGTGAAITIKGDNIDVDFQGATLEGTAPTVEPDERKGTAIRVLGNNVTIRNVRARGFKIGLVAQDSAKLSIVDSDFSYNWKQRLKSTEAREDLSDWMSFHQNEKDEWLRFGAGVYLKNCDDFKVRGVQITGGQSGLMLSGCDEGMVFNCDFSFLSAIGLGLYRTNKINVQHNRIDWCVRGYSHGVYNRGQDSAGILVYEQSSNNTFAYNSVTHGGDGFFLWAGQSTMDTGQGGCNDNLVFGNDFSHAPTNGIETTFSRNKFVHNLVQECWHGVWGGYSYGSLFLANEFARNAEGISIEHGQDNKILDNKFNSELIGIQLWQNAEQDPNWGYPKNRDTRSRDATINGNSFFNINGPVLDLRGIDGLNCSNNTFLRCGPLLNDGPRANNLKGTGNLFRVEREGLLAKLLGEANFTQSTLDIQAKYTVEPPTMQPGGNSLIPESPVDLKTYLKRFNAAWSGYRVPNNPLVKELVPAKIPGGKNPFLKGGVLRGRRYILVDAWGPYDFRYPKLVLRERKGSTATFELLGPRGKWRLIGSKGVTPSATEGLVPGSLSVNLDGNVNDLDLILEYKGGETVDYRGIAQPAGTAIPFRWSVFSVPMSWRTQWWNYDLKSEDPRTKPPTFARAPNLEKITKELAYAWSGSPGPGVQSDHFLTRAETEFEVPPGEYVISVTADDGVRVWLDDELIVDEWHYSGPTTYEVRKVIQGKHRLKIEHFELDGYSTLKCDLRRP